MGGCATSFIVSTGRCGTTLLGVALGGAPGALVLNEGQLRDADARGPQVLKAMTLENKLAYMDPSRAEALLHTLRKPQVERLAGERGLSHFVEIAYYLCPFVEAIPRVFPGSRVVFVHRDGRDFVRSAYVREVPDPWPVGYPDPRPLTPAERFVALGRLEPRPGSAQAAAWPGCSPLEKNAWLWAETNRLVLEQLESWPAHCKRIVPMSRLLTPDGLLELADFLDLELDRGRAAELCGRRINARQERILPHWTQWEPARRQAFARVAQDMLETLGYETSDRWTDAITA